MDFHKYVDIERLKDKYALAFKSGEHITVTEKVDGSNASIRYNPVTCSLEAFSRRCQLDASNNLRGFYTFVLTLDPVLWSNVTGGGRYTIFGEWLVSHTIRYPDSAQYQFYVFDAWDNIRGEYTPWAFTYQLAQALGLKTVPVFYDGVFTTWDDLYALVGKTSMNAEPCGEGIVIKSQDRLDNKFSGTPAYVKIVAKEFSEVHQSKPHEVDPEKLAAKQAAEALAQTIVTERRVTKTIEKFIEDNLIPENWDEKNLGDIAKILPRAIYNDCVKEEPEIVAQIENFGKICSGIAMKHARNLVK